MKKPEDLDIDAPEVVRSNETTAARTDGNAVYCYHQPV